MLLPMKATLDGLNGANTLATIVQLLGLFAQERKDAADLTHERFVEWLQYHKHEQLVDLICNTAAIQGEVTNLLSAGQATILTKLGAIDGTLAALLSRVQALAPLALAVAPSSTLSDQAIFVLRQLASSSSRYLVFAEVPDGCVFQLESGDVLQYYEERFLADDLQTLAAHGLLTPESTASNFTTYRFTRVGLQFIAALPASDESEARAPAHPSPPSPR